MGVKALGPRVRAPGKTIQSLNRFWDEQEFVWDSPWRSVDQQMVRATEGNITMSSR